MSRGCQGCQRAVGGLSGGCQRAVRGLSEGCQRFALEWDAESLRTYLRELRVLLQGRWFICALGKGSAAFWTTI